MRHLARGRRLPAHARPRAGRRGPQRGAALLLAMLILTLVATLTAGMVWQQSRSLRVEAAERARVQSLWILSGALDWARLILREDLRGGGGARAAFDSLDEPWATPLAEARLSSFLAADKDNNADSGPEAFISGSITDAQSRWNLRNLAQAVGDAVPAPLAVLTRLCAQANLPGDTATRIHQGLRAAFPQPGTEAGDVALAPLQPARLADLVWLGIEPALIERLAPWVELLPVPTPVNVNTAPPDVLLAVIPGLDRGLAERLVQQRQRKPFETIDAFKQELRPEQLKDATAISVGSSWFEVAGRLRLEERVLEERSLLERQGIGGAAEVRVVRRERLSLRAEDSAASSRRP